MRLLLDTHTLTWSLIGPRTLSQVALDAVASDANEVYVSIGSAWEIAIKVGLGKWPEAEPLLTNFAEKLDEAGFALLPITLDHVRTAGLMQHAHRDPFDRLLAAQARIEGLALVTADARLADLGATVLW